MIGATATAPLRGTVRVPGDKSITHRLAILAALARGPSRIRTPSPAGDCAATIAALAGFGLEVSSGPDGVVISGRGPEGLGRPAAPIDCERSATTMRLLAGVAAGLPFDTSFTGDGQLLRRPMERVAAPLRRMGARVETARGGRPPLRVAGGRLRGRDHVLPVASAQVKSAVLLASMRAEGRTVVEEPHQSRDHTERLLGWLGAPIARFSRNGHPAVATHPCTIETFKAAVPGDLSSAAFLAAGAALVAGSDVVVEGVGLNPTRTGFLDVLSRMGARVETEILTGEPEPTGRLRVGAAPLAAVDVSAVEVPGVIDELPLIALLATAAEGATTVTGAGELRVKESDRIAGVLAGLRALGADTHELPDGFAVTGPTPLRGGEVEAHGDHRVAMTFALAGLVAAGPVRVHGIERAADSFPGFASILGELR
ncbi:MAG TPA: 3-phosphoshikimate 1-carboxyvinyltransferase [Actinomycetota bacterium]|nr:3-phosphoshikimate 1-carboxyvinyltransferase [Actinomycetota bacterium]